MGRGSVFFDVPSSRCGGREPEHRDGARTRSRDGFATGWGFRLIGWRFTPTNKAIRLACTLDATGFLSAATEAVRNLIESLNEGKFEQQRELVAPAG
jgi:hypothetical protein